jgi:hypothetical protein
VSRLLCCMSCELALLAWRRNDASCPRKMRIALNFDKKFGPPSAPSPPDSDGKPDLYRHFVLSPNLVSFYRSTFFLQPKRRRPWIAARRRPPNRLLPRAHPPSHLPGRSPGRHGSSEAPTAPASPLIRGHRRLQGRCKWRASSTLHSTKLGPRVRTRFSIYSSL